MVLLSSDRVQRSVKLNIGLVALGVFTVAVGIEAAHFAYLAELFLRLRPTSDSQLYLAMARAWLNGFHLYRDLFETKPPGVFLLAALAMRLGGGFPLYVWFQLVLLVLMCPVLGLYGFVRFKSVEGAIRLLAIVLCLLLGITIAVTALSQTIGFQAEGFALVFATLTVLLFAMPATDSRQLVADLISGVSLGVASMFKEPFAGSALLGMLVFVRSSRDGYRVLRILAAAAVTGTVILVASASFTDYVSLYLPEMFSGRATDSIMYPDFGARLYFVLPAPMWVRMLNVYKLFTAIGSSPVPALLLPVFFGLCMCLWVPLRTKNYRITTVLVSAALVVTVIVVGHVCFVLYELVSALHTVGKDVPWGDPIIVRLLAIVIVPPVVLAVATVGLRRRFRLTLSLGSQLAFAVLWMLAVGGLVAWGGDVTSTVGVGEHIVFAFPPLLGLAAYCIGVAVENRQHVAFAVLASLLTVNAVMPTPYEKVASLLVTLSARSGTLEQPAAELDEMLSSCNESRYILASPQLQQLPAFTLHSPYQITYGAARSIGGFAVTSANSAPNAYLAAKLKQDLASTRIIVAAADDDVASALKTRNPLSVASTERDPVLTMDPVPGMPVVHIAYPIAEAMRDDFTTAAPECAHDKLPIPGLQVFFRRH